MALLNADHAQLSLLNQCVRDKFPKMSKRKLVALYACSYITYV